MSTTDKKQPSLNTEVLELATKFEALLSVDATTGAGTKNGNVYETLMPEHLTPEIVRNVSDYNSTFVAAGTYAFGNLSIKAMSGNKDLKETSIAIPMGENDNLKLAVTRSAEFTNAFSKDKEKITKYGQVSVDYQVQSGANGGQLKVARKLLGQIAAEALK